jgi:hypothetical protein
MLSEDRVVALASRAVVWVRAIITELTSHLLDAALLPAYAL